MIIFRAYRNSLKIAGNDLKFENFLKIAWKLFENSLKATGKLFENILKISLENRLKTAFEYP